MTRRLLALSWEMPPLSGPRAIQVARLLTALARQGWTPTVIAVQPRPGGPLLRDATGAPQREFAGVEIVRVPSPEESWPYRAAMRIPGAADWPDRHRGWLPPATREAERRLRADDYQALVTFAQPWTDHLVGLGLRREHQIPWIAHFSDPWSDSPYQPTRYGALTRARRYERDVIREADAVVFVTAETADVVMSKYPVAWRRKAHVVPHGYDRHAVESVQRTRQPGRRMRLVYTGRFYDGLRTPETLFAALSRLRHAGKSSDVLEVRLIGPNMTNYTTAVRAHQLEAIVQLVDAVPYRQAQQEAANADVLLVVDAHANGPSMFLPSKLVDYLVWRTPILGLTPREGATASLLHRLELPTADPADVPAIAHALDGLLDQWSRGDLQVSARFDTVAAEYSIDRAAAAFAGLLDRWQ